MQNLIESPTFSNGALPLVPPALIPTLQDDSPALAPLVVRAGEGVYGDFSTYRGLMKLDVQSTGGAFILLDVQCDPGQGVPLHVHQHEDEIFHILEGRFQIQRGASVCEAGPGDTVLGPRGEAHSWTCSSAEPGRLVIVVTPGANFQEYLLEALKSAQAPSQAMRDTAQHYGITMLPQEMDSIPQPVSVTQGRFVDLGDHRGTFDVSSQDSNGAIAVLNMAVDFQGGPPPHLHHQEEETFVIVRGRFRALLGETILEVGPGDIVFAPRGHAHDWQCLSEEGGHALVLVTPGENFEIFAAAMSEGQLMPPTQPGALEKLLALAEQHNLTMLPPVW